MFCKMTFFHLFVYSIKIGCFLMLLGSSCPYPWLICEWMLRWWWHFFFHLCLITNCCLSHMFIFGLWCHMSIFWTVDCGVTFPFFTCTGSAVMPFFAFVAAAFPFFLVVPHFRYVFTCNTTFSYFSCSATFPLLLFATFKNWCHI